jgi:hypothetical protein
MLISPDKVDAGAVMTIAGKILCTPAQALDGAALSIRDHQGAEVTRIPVDAFDGETNTTASVSLKAPKAPGRYIWSAQLIAATGVSSALALPPEQTRFEIVIVPHATRLMIWDVPSAVEIGQQFSVKIGLKCSSGCDMSGRRIVIRDHAGNQAGTAALTGARWLGSDDLQVAELELSAPGTEELYSWHAYALPDNADPQHSEAKTGFAVRAVALANCTVRIEAVDKKTDVPLPNMNVVMHPYRGRTDASGTADIRVAQGTYSVFVSGQGYYPVRRELEVTEDLVTRAPLEPEPPPSKDW